MRRPTTTEPETHVGLFTAGFLGRGFDSRRLHQILEGDVLTAIRYTVSLVKSEEVYSVWVPGLPGCASQGETEKEALENISDAIREYLAVADELASEGDRREVTVLR